MSSSSSVSASATDGIPFTNPSDIPYPNGDPVPAHHASPVVAFIIGLAIVILASILNAAGLNLTKLDHVRTSAIPKASRRRDWLRPLWLLGMVLYILSQLIGSTLALEYMRAEYVAPLGSTSLIFNFLFAKFLVNSPVTKNDIWGTVIVIIGVIGIVAFGSINSGLSSETNAAHLAYLWSRGNWLAYFFFMTFALFALYTFTSQLEAVLAARSDISAVPFSATSTRRPAAPPVLNWFGKVKALWDTGMMRAREYLELWTATHDDKRIAWTLGIGWACCGGGLAGGCLVFAKAAVKLTSGALSHQNTGNQFGQASSIFTFIFLAITAVLQIICLNRGLKVYDSTLVVPVFYGVYTAAGFLDSLIFNDEVDAYESWDLFLIFVSILVLVSGVVLLTHKKPDPSTAPTGAGGTTALASLSPRARRTRRKADKDSKDNTEEAEALRTLEEGENEDEVLWQVGEASDDEEGNFVPPRREGLSQSNGEGERQRMMNDHEDGDSEYHRRRSTSSEATLARQDGDADAEEFGVWGSAKVSP
ncbi:hypothetical protein K474DRAFT_1656812 [Panus rudis PR-1116 ss-1]|nr:hypothetical protein K474DRAFT_1656812 [Panus rudis PR-1116 ss-1]